MTKAIEENLAREGKMAKFRKGKNTRLEFDVQFLSRLGSRRLVHNKWGSPKRQYRIIVSTLCFRKDTVCASCSMSQCLTIQPNSRQLSQVNLLVRMVTGTRLLDRTRSQILHVAAIFCVHVLHRRVPVLAPTISTKSLPPEPATL